MAYRPFSLECLTEDRLELKTLKVHAAIRLIRLVRRPGSAKVDFLRGNARLGQSDEPS